MQSPPFAAWPLFKYIPKELVIWESACGKGYLSDEFTRNGYTVISTDLEMGYDFFNYNPPRFDVQVTNPPFDIKNDWLKRSLELGKPFALLLPVESMSTPERIKMFRHMGLQIILPNHRYHFETPNLGVSSWLDTCWYCYGLNLGRDIQYHEYELDSDGWTKAVEDWKSHLASARGMPKKRRNSSRD